MYLGTIPNVENDDEEGNVNALGSIRHNPGGLFIVETCKLVQARYGI